MVSVIKDLMRTDERFISSVNSFVEDLSEKVDTPLLGSQYTFENDTTLVQKWLCNYRLKKKFCVPKVGHSLADKTVTAMLAYDIGGLTSFVPSHMKMSPHSRVAIYKARLDLHEAFKDFKLDYHAASIPSGETCITSRGDVSIFAKLSNKKYWTVTSDCFDLAATVIYKNLWIKRIAKTHMLDYSPTENYVLWDALGDGFEVFKCKLLDFMTIVSGSRITTVPKNNDEDRCINAEPLFNMIVQSIISNSFRHILKKHFGSDLETTQMRHREMISDLSLSTIDLSKASDSNWLCVLEFLYPKRVVDYLKRGRSPVGTYKGAEHAFNMLSPMGNGFTFEVMTTTLLAIARQYCHRSSVFGDDIIISNEVACDYIETISVLGYRINETKSFVEGFFRESCGGFFHKDTYLKSYDFWYAADRCDAIVLVNKLILLRHIFDIEESLKALIQSSIHPALLKEGSFVEGVDDLSRVIHIPLDFFNVKRFKRKCRCWTESIPGLVRRMSTDIRDYTYDHRKVDFYVDSYKVTQTYVSSGRWKAPIVNNVRSRALIGSYLYSGMCSAPIIRNKNLIKGTLIVY